MEYTCKGMCSTHTSSLNLMEQCKNFLKIVGQMLQPLFDILAMVYTEKKTDIELKIIIDLFFLFRGQRTETLS